MVKILSLGVSLQTSYLTCSLVPSSIKAATSILPSSTIMRENEHSKTTIFKSDLKVNRDVQPNPEYWRFYTTNDHC